MAEKIKITTQYLKAKEGQWLELAHQAEKSFFQAGDTADKLCRCFWGQPVCKLKTDFSVAQGEGEIVFAALAEHIKKLSEIARIYEEAERSNVDVLADH
ncbi:MAG: hypothetical protein NC400_08205 [Clostridium sp.]|nr:hypothetical protein [Clostridium sp.]